MEGTFWALIPTLIAVVFALITKEVFISLFIGIFTGAMLIAGGNPIIALSELFNVMATKTGADIIVANGDSQIAGLGNAGILIFILELGILVALMNKSGGTAAFGNMITRHVKTEKSALIATAGLGCLIFMDDYFNRLAVGSIMRPVCDKFDISRVKLAYIIGSISVSICILIPISSWASAISGNIGEGLGEGGRSFEVYLSTLLCNFYPILTLLFLFISPLLNIDLINTKKEAPSGEVATQTTDTKGSPIDLIFPIASLIILSIVFMAFTSYASETTLVMSGAITIILCLALYLPRKIMTLKEFTDCFSCGFKSVVDVIIILVFAWTLTGMCERLNVGAFIHGLTEGMGSAQTLLPAILFVAAMGTAFSTGTAWGTFGMLVPLTVPMFEAYSTLQILSIAAVLSGSVFGNQVSPISDSTLLASKVCECDHMSLIKAQLPAALVIAAIAFCAFLVSGVTSLIWLGWIVAAILFAALVLVAYLKKRPHCKKASIYKSLTFLKR